MPPLTYPDESGKHLGTILVHPIPEDIDSQLEGLPGVKDVPMGKMNEPHERQDTVPPLR